MSSPSSSSSPSFTSFTSLPFTFSTLSHLCIFSWGAHVISFLILLTIFRGWSHVILILLSLASFSFASLASFACTFIIFTILGWRSHLVFALAVFGRGSHVLITHSLSFSFALPF